MRLSVLLLAIAPLQAEADPARVEGADLRAASDGTVTATVTIRHGDTGWDDYADGWRIEAPDGTILGTRVLHHPHVEEQPFTRSLSGVAIPEGLRHVVVRARTSTTGWAEEVHGPVPVPAAP
jgi:hypothetical protein